MRTGLVRILGNAVAFVVLSTAVLTCNDDDPPNAPPVVNGSGVTVTPAMVELPVGGTQTLQATVRDESGSVSPATVQWTSRDAAVATVNGAGVVSAVAIGTARIIATSGGDSDSAVVRVIPGPPLGAAMEVYPEVTYQHMTGWEGTAQMGEVECNRQAYNLYKGEVRNRLVNELGINRVRLELRSGAENPVDYYTAYRNSADPAPWRPHRYESINDNADPRSINAAGFQWAEIDHVVDEIVQPMRALMQARGERLYVNLNYVDFGPAAFEQSSDPEEYAELIQAAFQHLQGKYGWVPDAVEIILEPDNTQNWRGQSIGRAMVAAGDRLKALGYGPAFIAPSNTNAGNALAYFDELVTVPRVLEYLTDFSYHRYAGASTGTLQAIAQRARQYGLRTGMLEHIGSGDADLAADLLDGANSSWQQFTLAFCATQDNGGAYYWVDQSTPSAPKINMGSRSRYLRHYFAFVRLNAVRVGALSGDQRLAPLAFRNTNGKLVVVIRAEGAAPVQLRRMPPGNYGVVITTNSQVFASLPDIAVGTAGTLQVNMPASGIMTIYAR